MKHMRPYSTTRNAGSFLFLILAWGSSYFWIKKALVQIPPLTIITWRVLIGFLGLLAIGVVSDAFGPKKPAFRDWSSVRLLSISKYEWLMGWVSIVIPFLLLTWGATYLPSSTAGVLNSTVPLFSMILAHFCFQDDPLTKKKLAGVTLGFAGVCLIALGSPQSAHGSQQVMELAASALEKQNSLRTWGALAILAASLSYATGSVLGRRFSTQRDPYRQALSAMATAALSLQLIHRVVLGYFPPLPTGVAFWSVLWLGLIGSCSAYFVYFSLLTRWGVSRTSLVMFGCPVVAVGLGTVLLGESLSAPFALGAIFVVMGLVIALWPRVCYSPEQRQRAVSSAG